jgi:hypothetical protein
MRDAPLFLERGWEITISVPVCDCHFGLSSPGGINLLMHKDLIREGNTSFPGEIGVFYFSYGNKIHQFLQS